MTMFFELLEEVRSHHIWLHDNFSVVKHPQIIYSSWFQDGVMHALDRIVRLKKTGIYSDQHKLQGTARSFFEFSRLYRRDKNYSDSAYCEGYANAYLYASLPTKDQETIGPPMFWYFNRGMQSRAEFKRELRKLPKLHNRAYKYAKALADKYGDDVVLDHKLQLKLAKYLKELGVAE